MDLAEKLAHLRAIEGQFRGHGRPLTKTEVVRAMREELGQSISHAYLCQLENGAREHMSARTRALLASFFKVHPGYLVGDPGDYQTGIISQVVTPADDLKTWLLGQAEATRDDPLVYHVLLRLARDPEPRRYFVLLNRLLDMPKEAIEQVQEAAEAWGTG